MCGIVGYIGEGQALPFIMEGLKRLEYRGYDSAGVAVFEAKGIHMARSVGKLSCLEAIVAQETFDGTMGIGHTRWATHGAPSDENSHPQRDSKGHFVVVHNGIIENYQELRKELSQEGYSFTSETDTEVLPNLISRYYQGNTLEAAWAVRESVCGSYAAVFMSDREPDLLVAMRKDSPLIVGVAPDGYYLASDIPAILGYAQSYYVLEDGEVAAIRRNSIAIYKDRVEVERQPKELNISAKAAEKGGYEHFMLKEIYEQPGALRDCLVGRLSPGEQRIDLGEMSLSREKIAAFKRIVMVACGTAYHACLVGKYIFEKLLAIPVEVDIASEFRYRDPIVGPDDLTIVISQSGETADTLAALKEARAKGSHIIAITNVDGSSVAREADDVIYTRAGHEIAVASTKAYITQVLAIYLLCFYMADVRDLMDKATLNRLVREIYRIPGKVESILRNSIEEIKAISAYISGFENAFYIGRGLDYVVAMEGALKLKEISYIHAEAYAAGELKHGTLALVVDKVPVLALATQEEVLAKTISNIKEVQARKAHLIALTWEGHQSVAEVADQTLYLPPCAGILAPLLTVVPLQLIAYYASVLRGADVDQPRNLAKSVTVE